MDKELIEYLEKFEQRLNNKIDQLEKEIISLKISDSEKVEDNETLDKLDNLFKGDIADSAFDDSAFSNDLFKDDSEKTSSGVSTSSGIEVFGDNNIVANIKVSGNTWAAPRHLDEIDGKSQYIKYDEPKLLNLRNSNIFAINDRYNMYLITFSVLGINENSIKFRIHEFDYVSNLVIFILYKNSRTEVIENEEFCLHRDEKMVIDTRTCDGGCGWAIEIDSLEDRI